jgi:hypothetical protein
VPEKLLHHLELGTNASQEPLVSDVTAELLAPNTVALHGYAGLQKPSRPAADTGTVLST